MVSNCGVATIGQRAGTAIANPSYVIGIAAKVPSCDSATQHRKNTTLNQLTQRKYNQKQRVQRKIKFTWSWNCSGCAWWPAISLRRVASFTSIPEETLVRIGGREGKKMPSIQNRKGFWIFRVLWKSPPAWTTVLIQSKDRIMPNQNNVLLSVTRI